MIFLLNWSEILFLTGRLHPFLVHFPIGILSVTVLMEFGCIFFNKKELGKTAVFTLSAGLIASILAGLSGYALSLDGGYSTDLLTPHRWAGISLVLMNLLALVLKTMLREKSWSLKIYVPTLTILLALVLYTGHLGGSLTHGPGFFDISQNDNLKQLKVSEAFPLNELHKPEEAYVFKDIIQPILHSHCGSCHNSQKRKGGLDVSTHSLVLEGGESGPVLVNSSAESVLLRRLDEPANSDDKMPPKGKLQLSDIQLELIRWWVAEKYPENIQLSFMDLPNHIESILHRISNQNHPVYSNDKVPYADEIVLTNLRKKGYGINTIVEESPFLDVLFKFKKGKAFNQIADDLHFVARNIAWLDLSGTEISEADFSQFENLIRLNLSQTNISDSALKSIASLRYLEYLNLHSTQVSSKDLKQLYSLSNLKKIYLWNTGIRPEEIFQLKLRLPSAEIVIGVSDG